MLLEFFSCPIFSLFSFGVSSYTIVSAFHRTPTLSVMHFSVSPLFLGLTHLSGHQFSSAVLNVSLSPFIEFLFVFQSPNFHLVHFYSF